MAPFSWGESDVVVGVLLFGGASSSGAVYNDSWQYGLSNHTWTNITAALRCSVPGHCPSVRHDAMMEWDPASYEILLFGGCATPTAGWTESTPGCYGSSGILGDTWTYAVPSTGGAGTWTHLSPSTSPPARFAAGMTYDPASGAGYMVMFGGCGAICPLGDTWKFSSGAWSNISPSSSPPARYGESLGFASAIPSPAVILFGGCENNLVGCGPSGPVDDTWAFSASPSPSWTELEVNGGCGAQGPVVCPPARFLAGSTTDSPPSADWEALVLNGGVGTDGIVYGNSTDPGGDWWAFGANGSATWTQYTAPPGFECTHGSAPCKSTWYRPGPPSPLVPRYSEALTATVTADSILLFGGTSSSGSSLGDTWEGTNSSAVTGGGLVWAPPIPSARYDGTMVYDGTAGYSVLFGGCSYGCPNGETWMFERSTNNVTGATNESWVSGYPPLDQGNSPPPRTNASMAYDPVLNEVILFGGEAADGQLLNDTWDYANGGWNSVSLSQSQAPPMQGASMAWDAHDSLLLLYGGLSQSGPQDTLYFLYHGQMNGQIFYRWSPVNVNTNLTTGFPPPALYGASMVYDSEFQRVILFGGCNSSECPVSQNPLYGNVYAFSNFSWTECANCAVGNPPPPTPPVRWDASMVDDPTDGYVLLFGGMGTSGPLGDTWSLVAKPPQACGASSRYFCAYWTSWSPPRSPSARWGAQADFDSNLGEVFLFGGRASNGIVTDEYGWEFSGGTWSPISIGNLIPQYPAPPPSFGGRMVYDGQNGFVILFGGCEPTVIRGGEASCGPLDGYSSTWEYANGEWIRLSTSGGPPEARWDEGLAFDAVSNEIVLFGGCATDRAVCSGTGSLLLGDTWELTLGPIGAGTWSSVNPSTSPSPRADMAMGYDVQDGVVVLFGGYGCSGQSQLLCDDTWTFSAGSWTLQSSTSPVSARFGAEMAYDPSLRGLLLVGGQSSNGQVLNDSWLYNVTFGWHGEPSALSSGYDGGMSYDPVLGAMILFGGIGKTGGSPQNPTEAFGYFGGKTNPGWISIVTSNSPSGRWGMGLVYDGSAGPMGYLLMFGGSVASNASEPGPGGLSGAYGESWTFYAFSANGVGLPSLPTYWLDLSDWT